MRQNLQFILFIVMLFCGTLKAQVFVNQSAVGNNDGTSWADAYTDLQSALDATTASEIWIAQGEYKPALRDSAIQFDAVAGHMLYGGFSASETTLDQRDFTANRTILLGDIAGDDVEGMYEMNKTDNATHLLYVGTHGETVVVDGLEFHSGSTTLVDDDALGAFWYRGAGIYSQSPMQIANCIFTNNSGYSGSAVYIGGSTGSTITDSKFEKNYSLTQAALQISNCIQPQVKNCQFIGNTVTRGALYTFACSNASIEDCEFTENVSHPESWGGIGFYNFSSIETSLTNCTFNNNSSLGNAAILYCDASEFGEDFPLTMTLTNCTFESNTSDAYGGNMYFWVSNYIMDGCTFTGNAAPNGGAIYHGNTRFDIRNTEFKNNTASFGASTLNYNPFTSGTYTNCLFEKNASETSGAAAMIGFSGSADFIDCEFSENTAAFGGAIYIQNDNSVVNIANCDFSSNSSLNSGGAIASFGSTQLSIDESTFLGNASSVGGAITMTDDTLNLGTLEVNKSKFTFNFADTQGGAINLGIIDATIKYSQFTNNEALDIGVGGAISNNAFNDQDAIVEIINCTIADNSGMLAAGIANYSDDAFSGKAEVRMSNSILWNDGGFGYAVEDGEETNLISNGGNHYQNPLLSDLFSGENDFFDDFPGFVDASNENYNLNGSSVCINQGLVISSETTDINGDPIVDAPDKGCYEFQGNVSSKFLIKEDIGRLLNNPAKDFTTLEFKHSYIGQIEISIFSTEGMLIKQLLHQKDAINTTVLLNVSDLITGSYIINVSLDENHFSKKLIKL